MTQSTPSRNNSVAKTNMIKLNSQSSSSFTGRLECSDNNTLRTVNSYAKASAQIPYKTNRASTSPLNPSSTWTTRFQDAASNLNRNRQYRHLGNASSPPSISVGTKHQDSVQATSTSVVLPHQQAPNQVSLDHDYCSPANKVRRQRNISSSLINNQQQLKMVGNYSNPKTYMLGNEPASNTKLQSMKRISHIMSPSNNSLHTSPHIIRKRAAALAATTLPADDTNKTPIIVPSSYATPITTSGTTIPLTIRSRPYVRVSTGNKVVTANLLKPTPLSSATMRQRSEIVSATVTTPVVNEVTSASYGKTSSRVVRIENNAAQGVNRTHATRINQQVIEFPTLSPQTSPSASSISLVGSNSRRDSDHKKDSGLESGEVSDDSRDGRTGGNGDETEGYSKLPSYLTTISVNNCSDSRTVSAIDDVGCYDRLPAYITGVGSRANSVEKNVPISIGDRKGHKMKSESGVDGKSEIIIEEPSGRSASKAKKSIKHHRRKDAGSESSRSRSRSPIGITTRLRGAPKLPVKTDGSVKPLSVKRPRKRSRTRSSSSSSNYLSSRSSSAESDDSTPSPIKEAKNKSKKRSRCKNSRRPSRSPEIATSRRNLAASNRSKVPMHRNISPRHNRSRSGRGGRSENENGSFRRFTRDRQRREQEERHNDQESNRQVEERRVVFVGKIAEGTTRADLRKRFEVFGPIVEISVHFRDNG